ncbi:MAG TPA: hypothetical protein VGO93_05155 [Candidatus Xenobia bacterium]
MHRRNYPAWQVCLLAGAFWLTACAMYFGQAYSKGFNDGQAAGARFGRTPIGFIHGQNFQQQVQMFLQKEVHRDQFPDRTLRDKAYNRGWDDAWHKVVGRILR